MDTMLRVLMVEDREKDVLSAEETLSRGGYMVIAQRVDAAAALDAALTDRAWDVILCDYSMPQFSGLDALALVRNRIPFILLSGVIGEEAADRH